MDLSSTAFAHGGDIPRRHTCEGEFEAELTADRLNVVHPKHHLGLVQTRQFLIA